MKMQVSSFGLIHVFQVLTNYNYIINVLNNCIVLHCVGGAIQKAELEKAVIGARERALPDAPSKELKEPAVSSHSELSWDNLL